MRQLDIRRLALGIAVLVALAIGTFVVLNHKGDTVQAAPEASQSLAEPQGLGVVRDQHFECAGYGIAVLMNQRELANYKCHSDAADNIDCLYNFNQNAITCTLGANTSVCQLTTTFPDTSEASCTDSVGSEHECSFGLVGVTCSTLSPAEGKDFLECTYSSRFEPFICGTEDGPLLCSGGPDTLLEIVCQTLTTMPSGLRADLDCDGEITSRDNQALLRSVLGNNPLSQTEPCPNLNEPFSFEPERPYDETAQAASRVSRSGAVPQGNFTDLHFQCTSFGITTLINLYDLGDYTCHSDASPEITCNVNQDRTVVGCSDGTENSECAITPGTDDTEATCTDTAGSEHTCFLEDLNGFMVSCTTVPGEGKDFSACDSNSGFGPHICGTEDGPLVCLVTPDASLTIICQTQTDMGAGLWADLDCDGEITSRDNQALLRSVLGNNPLSQTEPCPNLGDPVSYMPDRLY